MTHPVETQPQGWAATLRAFAHPRVITMLFLGFSAGIPLLLIFSSLSLWLGEAGIERKNVTFFSWAALAYSFKFLWAPLVDKIPLPVLTQSLGRRRGWLLVAQCGIVLSILLMSMIDPSQGESSLVRMAIAALLLGISAATQDIVIDAYRIESAGTELQALMSSAYIAGYRLAMVVSGAGALFIAAYLGSAKGHYLYNAWQYTYFIMASTMAVGIVTTFLIPEPQTNYAPNKYHYETKDYLQLLLVFLLSVGGFVATFFFGEEILKPLKDILGKDDALVSFLIEALHFGAALGVAVVIGLSLVSFGAVNKAMAHETWVEPIKDFFGRYGVNTALVFLALMSFYRISDIVLGVMSNVFYQDMGFSKEEIATAVKTFGVIVSIGGGFLGGLLVARFGVMRILMLGAALAVVANGIFISLANMGHNLPLMYLAVGFDNFEAGLAGAAFIAFVSSLTSGSFTAIQYAVFSSLMTLLPKVIGGYGGTIVDNIGYQGFFTFTSLIGIPVMFIVWLADKHLKRYKQSLNLSPS